MAKNDILPFRSPMGGHCKVTQYPIAASQSFEEGEPVFLDTGSSNQLTECVDEPQLETTLIGISAENAYGQDGSTALSANELVAVYDIGITTEYITKNYSTAGVGVAVAITGAIRGTLGGLMLNGGTWFVDTAAGTNKTVIITDVLDANLAPVTGSTSGTYILVKFTRNVAAGA